LIGGEYDLWQFVKGGKGLKKRRGERLQKPGKEVFFGKPARHQEKVAWGRTGRCDSIQLMAHHRASSDRGGEILKRGGGLRGKKRKRGGTITTFGSKSWVVQFETKKKGDTGGNIYLFGRKTMEAGNLPLST